MKLKAGSFGFLFAVIIPPISGFPSIFRSVFGANGARKKGEQRLYRCQTRKAPRYLPLSFSSIQNGGFLILF